MPAADVGRGAEQRPLMVGGTSFDVDGSSSRQNARFLKSKYNYRWTHGICNLAVLKIIHLLYGAGIQTHDLQNTSLLS